MKGDKTKVVLFSIRFIIRLYYFLYALYLLSFFFLLFQAVTPLLHRCFSFEKKNGGNPTFLKPDFRRSMFKEPHYAHSMAILFGAARALRGNVTLRIPFLNEACTFSLSTSSGIWKLRLNEE